MSDYLPGLEGVPATRSNISVIDGEKGILAYRGYPIEQLAKHSTFEETTMLLLDGRLPTAGELAEFDRQLRRNRRVKFNIREIMKNLPATGHPMEMLQTAIASLGMFYPSNECLTGSALCEDLNYIHRMTVKLLARIPVIVAMWQHIRQGYDPIPPREDLTTAENFLYMLHGREPDPLYAEIMDTCLVLHAEHTINASTFAALVAGSTLASPYGVIASAVGTLSGPLHGGANEKVVGMLEQIGSPQNAETWLDEQLKKKAKIWGFGHREYSVKDPRANILQKLMEKLARTKGTRHSRLFDTALALEEVAEERLGAKGVFPNVDYYSGILYTEMGIPTDQFTPIFAISRAAGWLAHWREQLSDNRIFRPTQVYIGEPIRDYVSIDKR
ncbi:MAG: citrate synthase [Gammaproteobacteria bacterium]|nr:citrate synthase [Gammaproteobacteria bacterium]MCW8841143.1 citrate synthase [Gammaproteobacteria bacterium]MCW8927630.1 citrate synthase [Gammaproteobacteria bacterium]MCW8957632.1 citrate synthase [Gammaproteobacteria bacterium]MCW8973003.1 citrate synthase [Gammaproteobacteria bacterium]